MITAAACHAGRPYDFGPVIIWSALIFSIAISRAAYWISQR